MVLEDDIFSFELGKELKVVNIYGPYRKMIALWYLLMSWSLMKVDNLVVGGI